VRKFQKKTFSLSSRKLALIRSSSRNKLKKQKKSRKEKKKLLFSASRKEQPHSKGCSKQL